MVPFGTDGRLGGRTTGRGHSSRPPIRVQTSGPLYYERLIAARRELVSELESLEESFKNPQQSEWESFDPSPDAEYEMTLEYLAALTTLMRKRAGEMTDEEDENASKAKR